MNPTVATATAAGAVVVAVTTAVVAVLVRLVAGTSTVPSFGLCTTPLPSSSFCAFVAVVVVSENEDENNA